MPLVRMTETNNPNDSIKLSKDERQFYDSIKNVLDEKLTFRQTQEKILKKLFQDIHDYYDKELGNGLTRAEIHNRLKPMYRGTPRDIAHKVSDIIITGIIEDSKK